MVRLMLWLCKHFINTAPIKKTNFRYRPSKNDINSKNTMVMQQKKILKLWSENNSTTTLQVLGNGTPGTPTCIFMTTDHINYVFNCGEATQRLAHEHGMKLAKVDHIFLTRPSWKNIGGLPGLLLTLQDTGVAGVNIHCAGNIQEFVDTTKQFITLSKFDIRYAPTDELEPYEDAIMRVYYVPLNKASKTDQETTSDLADASQHCSNENGKRVIDVKTENESSENKAKRFKANTDLLCFICEIKPRPGKLLIAKCMEYGINPGPLYALLKKGIDVTKSDGTVVFSKDVCSPVNPTTYVIVIECPTNDYLDSLVNHSAFSKYQNVSLAERDELLCVFHITPDEIFNDSQYQDWIKKFSPNVQHIVLNSKNSGISNESSLKNQYLLNMLHPEIFPLLHEDRLNDCEETESNIHRGKVMQTLKLHPRVEGIIAPDIGINLEAYVTEATDINGFSDALSKLRINVNKITIERHLADAPEFPRVIMLGTGSSTPNKLRNTSGILLRIDEGNSIVLDCGEGTLSQMIQFYGNSEIDNILRSIKAIYVSHMHADHHLGLIGILQRRAKCTNDRIVLFAPYALSIWLSSYDMNFEQISNMYSFVNNYNMYLNNHKLSAPYESTLCKFLNIKEIDTVFVKHCKHAYAVAITLNDGNKIVYSGDTMPCQNLITLGKDCDLLIHEATMEDRLKELAAQKLHSTISDAINAGKLMNAKFTLLTHFSQRYAKLPVWTEKDENVGLAYDNMEIKLSQLQLLHLFYPCLKLMFTGQKTTVNLKPENNMLAV